MKAMKQLLIVVALMSCTTMLMATQYQLYQTSPATYRSIGSNGAGSTSMIGNCIYSASMPISNISAGVAKPSFNFYSTSTMSSSGSTLLSTDTDMVIGTDNPSPSDHGMSGPRKTRPGDNKDPYEDPLTDAVPCLLLLALGYALRVGKKYGHRQPDTGK